MPSPQVVTEQTEAEAREEADQRAADEAIEEFGEQAATTTPEVDEELAEPVRAGQDSFFAGEETIDDRVSGEDAPDDDGGEFDGMTPDAGEDAGEHSFEDAINQGSARLAVVGLEDDKQNDLQGEFEEVFEAFQLGHYGNRVMHDYFLHGADDVHPVWGLAGSAMLCTVMVVSLRPDGDEAVSTVKTRLRALTNGGDAQ